MSSKRVTVSLPQSVYDAIADDMPGVSVPDRLRMLAIEYAGPSARRAVVATTPKPPKPPGIAEQRRVEKVHRELMRSLSLYKDKRGDGMADEYGNSFTWEGYLRHMRRPEIRDIWDHDPVAFDDQIDEVLELRRDRYLTAQVLPPPLDPFLVEYLTPHCPHREKIPPGKSRPDACYDCDVEDGLA